MGKYRVGEMWRGTGEGRKERKEVCIKKGGIGE